MTEPQKNLVKQWMLKAENDLLNVANNLQSDSIPYWKIEEPNCDG